MRLFSVAPFDQNLTLETGQCLDDDKATLADLRILPGSLIYLKKRMCIRAPLRPHLGLTEETHASGPTVGPTWPWLKKHKWIRAPLRAHLGLTEETHVHQGPTEAPLGHG
ncbi:hypothetical protein NP493_283g05036 [Ridgeia piscesae]|uniref:Ubiquitin-like domain-containing protein n=1 Tax=Ridgeia piscesae TaxID=27915 RepID=A0AAD9NX54_RIDPI|nr:hypothetical protein NP493_283g05036 [Ridgeia piscesae]